MPFYLIFVAILLMLPGLAGVLLPAVPGLPYMFLVALIFAIIDGFTHIRPYEVSILIGIVAISIAVDYMSGILGAKYGGASKQGLLSGLVGMLGGTIFFPPFGGIIGLFIGIFLAESYGRRTRQEALKAASGGVIGSVASIAINIVLGLIFIGLFAWFAL